MRTVAVLGCAVEDVFYVASAVTVSCTIVLAAISTVCITRCKQRT